MRPSRPRSRPVHRPETIVRRRAHPSWGIAERPNPAPEAFSASEFWARLGI